MTRSLPFFPMMIESNPIPLPHTLLLRGGLALIFTAPSLFLIGDGSSDRNMLDKQQQQLHLYGWPEVEDELATLGPESPLDLRLQALHVGARIEDVVGGALERCFATIAAVVWVPRGRDGVWKEICTFVG